MADKSKIRLELEAKANDLGITFPSNIGDKKLGEKVAEATTNRGDGNSEPNQGNPPPADDGQKVKAGASDTPAQKTTPVQARKIDVLTVVGPQQGFRRAGRQFGPEPVHIPLADLSDADILALKNEPMLVASIAQIDAG